MKERRRGSRICQKEYTSEGNPRNIIKTDSGKAEAFHFFFHLLLGGKRQFSNTPQIKGTRTRQSNRNNSRKIQLNSDTQLRQHRETRDGSQIGSQVLEVHEVYHTKRTPGDDSPSGRSVVSE